MHHHHGPATHSVALIATQEGLLVVARRGAIAVWRLSFAKYTRLAPATALRRGLRTLSRSSGGPRRLWPGSEPKRDGRILPELKGAGPCRSPSQLSLPNPTTLWCVLCS